MALPTTTGNGTEPGTDVPRSAMRQVVETGTEHAPDGGVVPDDYVADLREPHRRMEIFEEMRLSDSAVNTGITARGKLINSANWTLTTPGANNADERERLEFAEDNIYPHLPTILRHLGTGRIHYGFGCIQPVYRWNDSPFFSNIQRGKTRRGVRRDRGRLIWLERIAHVRQRTVSEFVVDTTTSANRGRLRALRQWGFLGESRSLREIEVPIEQVVLSTYDLQGDDHYGQPPTRMCYRDYKFKQQIEKLALLGFDKFGVGTPVVTEGEGWSQGDKSNADIAARRWRSGAEAFVRLARGGKVEIITGDGGVSMSALEWVRFFMLNIAKTYLTQQTELGSTETGARAVGDMMFEHLEGIVQDDCEDIATVVNERIIVPIIDYNFGPQEVYPSFAPSQRVRATGVVGNVIVQLIGAGAVHWRPQDESWLRDITGMPEVEITLLEDEYAEREEAAAALRDSFLEGGATDDEEDTDDDGEEGGRGDEDRGEGDGRPGARDGRRPAGGQAGREPGGRVRRIAAHRLDGRGRHAARGADRAASRSRDGVTGDGRRRLAAGPPPAPAEPRGAPAPAVPHQTTWRTIEYSEWEDRTVRPLNLSRDLDLQASRVTSEWQEILRDVDADLVNDVERVAGMGAARLADHVAEIAVAEALVTRLTTALAEAARRAREYGENSVLTEIARQDQPDDVGPSRAPALAVLTRQLARTLRSAGRAELARMRLAGEGASGTPTPEELREHLIAAEVARVVQLEVSRRTDSARGAATNAIAAAGALPDFAAIARVRAENALADLSPYRTEDNMRNVVNVGFGAGRSDGRDVAIAAGEPLRAKVYSAVMDFGSCDQCAQWDGGEFPLDHPEDATGVQAPNPRCEGGYGRCRCIWVYVLQAETIGTPATVGPVPGLPRFTRTRSRLEALHRQRGR